MTSFLKALRARRRELIGGLLAGVLVLGGAEARAQVLTVNAQEPIFDSGTYGNYGDPGTSAFGGTRGVVSTFGDVGGAGDDRFAQVWFGFSSTGIVPTNRPITDYKILEATVSLMLANDTKIYDPTYDPVVNGAIADTDPGRPMELYGAGYRYGLSASSISDDTDPRATGDGPKTLPVYATDFLAGGSLSGNNRDVSNNVDENFNPTPFAIGKVAANRLVGGIIKADTQVTFTLDLANPDVVRYLQLSLQLGRLVFVTSSLDGAVQQSTQGIASYYTKESPDLAALPPQLFLRVEMIPEPSAITLLLCGIALFLATWRGSRAWRHNLT